jgi:hypothetical protein
LSDFAVWLLFLGGFLFALFTCGFAADHILPRCRRLSRLLCRILKLDNADFGGFL